VQTTPLRRFVFAPSFHACILFLAAVLFATAISTSASAQETRRHYLSGTGIDDAIAWDFFCTEGRRSGEWTTIPVPSNWDALGFGALAYGHRPDTSEKKPVEHGKYRTRFRTPADWTGHTVFLVFEGSMTDTQAWINGQSAGALHQGGFYRFRYEVTTLLKTAGEENILEVDVAKESADASINRAERQGDYWNFGGIFRPVYLEARPTAPSPSMSSPQDRLAPTRCARKFSTSPATPSARPSRVPSTEPRPASKPRSTPRALGPPKHPSSTRSRSPSFPANKLSTVSANVSVSEPSRSAPGQASSSTANASSSRAPIATPSTPSTAAPAAPVSVARTFS
jgi:hypothetical protein